MKCPSEECHQNVQDMKTLLNNVAICLNKKISTNLAIAFLAFALTFSGGFILYGFTAEKKQNDKIAEVPVIQSNIEHIKDDMVKMDKKLDCMKADRKEDVLVLHQRITISEEKILKAIEKLDAHHK